MKLSKCCLHIDLEEHIARGWLKLSKCARECILLCADKSTFSELHIAQVQEGFVHYTGTCTQHRCKEELHIAVHRCKGRVAHYIQAHYMRVQGRVAHCSIQVQGNHTVHRYKGDLHIAVNRCKADLHVAVHRCKGSIRSLKQEGSPPVVVAAL